jgi:adenylosuccinate synthase
LPDFFKQIEQIEAQGCTDWQNRFIISDRAYIVFDFYQQVDQLQELEKGSRSLGTTKKGIGLAYASKADRTGIRISELLGNYDIFSEKFKSLVSIHQAESMQIELGHLYTINTIFR